ncbi:hypothetical protein QYF36_004276 [Acer negundo]|nr:hypothetical protein QYF36_004276 [Acer negundo]
MHGNYGDGEAKSAATKKKHYVQKLLDQDSGDRKTLLSTALADCGEGSAAKQEHQHRRKNRTERLKQGQTRKKRETRTRLNNHSLARRSAETLLLLGAN